jgi:hypothetical protein
MDRQWWLDLVAGMALGGMLMAAIFFVEWVVGCTIRPKVL